MGIVVDNLDRVVAQARRSGYEVLQSGQGHGVRGDATFVSLSTENDLFTVYELIELVSERNPAERVFPEQAA